MKKLTTLFLMGVICGTVWGQNLNKPFTVNYNSGEWKQGLNILYNGYTFGRLELDPDNNFNISNMHNQSIIFRTNATERLRIAAGGYVGIGTTSPKGKLHIAGSTTGLVTSTSDESHFQYNWNPAGDQAYIWSSTDDMKFGTATGFNAKNWSEKLRITKNGHVEATGYLKSKVTNGTNILTPTLLVRSQGNATIFQSAQGGALYFFGGSSAQSSSVIIGNYYTNDTQIATSLKVGATEAPSATLDVAGNIKAHEIEVTLASMQDLQLNGTLAANNITYTANGNTADFVFEDNYKLKDLSEVEAFIKNNKHLPEIPSAEEMEKGGVNLAEMNKLLLMKVEELTLYSIQLENEVKRQKAEVEKMTQDRRRLTELEERLAKLESILTKY